MHWIALAALVLLVSACVASDLRHRTIPNRLLLAGLAVALPLALSGGTAGLTTALAGGLVGTAVLLPMYAAGVMGAGDVKLMGVAGTFLGNAALAAALYSLVAGLLLALAVGWRSGRKGQLPYAPAIAAGVLAGAWTGGSGWA